MVNKGNTEMENEIQEIKQKLILTEMGIISPSLKEWAISFIEKHGDFEDMKRVMREAMEAIEAERNNI